MDHRRYIDEILPVALKYGNEGFGDNWTFQKDGAKSHTHSEWCPDEFSIFHRQRSLASKLTQSCQLFKFQMGYKNF